MKFRPLFFWLHLVAGLVAGSVIAIMSFTGAALAFEKEILAWAERDVRQVTPRTGARPLPLADLLAKARSAQPSQRPTGITLSAKANEAVLLTFGRTNALYVNPYTGETAAPSATILRRFMQWMIDWHRWLGRDARRPIGKAMTGACNVAFFVLAVTGLYLWWPRQWSRPILRATTVLNLRAQGKARDWNWHNAVGFWSSPILIVLTLTAMPISYRWASDLIYRMTGNEPPAQGQAQGSPYAIELAKPAEGAKPLNHSQLLTKAQEAVPDWQQITLRLGGGGPREGHEARNGERSGDKERRGPQPVSITIKQRNAWPKFAATQLTLDPFTGAVLRTESYADYNSGRRLRSWTRFLHTGEALGPIGQAIAGLASLGVLLLVYTGFALAWRRFFPAKRRLDSALESSNNPATTPVVAN